MRGIADTLSIGQRVAWYRRRRGMTQEVLAGRTGRGVDWLRKIENDKIELDRVSVIKALADALDVTIGDLLAEPSLLDWTAESGTRTLPALRAALMNYRHITALGSPAPATAPLTLPALSREVSQLWDAYQSARFGYVTTLLPQTLVQLQTVADSIDDPHRAEAARLLALSYQLASVQLTKLGEVELAWIAADRGLVVARTSDNLALTASLLRSVAHALLAAGRFREAVDLTNDTANLLDPHIGSPDPDLLAVYGTALLVGSMAAARADDAATTRTFLDAADKTAARLGGDTNRLWTAFGPTNVAIHRVSTAAELGDVQVAIDLGIRVDTTNMPTERRVRHALEISRAYSHWNRTDEAMTTLLEAERIGPEQVRYHFLSRQLVLSWIRGSRGKPSSILVDLAHRLRVLER
jgi:transcriptional regulator with XRE-family HTH domain